MQPLIVSDLRVNDDAVEIVERKGHGHPDTICDALAENLSRNLCREYRRRFGQVLHHNGAPSRGTTWVDNLRCHHTPTLFGPSAREHILNRSI